MDIDIPFLTGYLNVPTQSGFSLNRISKKKSCQRYCLLYKSSRHGIERLEICETKDDKNPKIITLENCVKITQESAANLIQIVKKTGTLTVNTLTDEDFNDWITALQTVAFRDKGGTHMQNVAIEEDNDLYCSSYGDGLFIVTLIPSDTSKRCNIEPKSYMLNLTATELELKSAEDLNIVIAKWPYRFIRKYGYRGGKFTFEAGRKCNTGEGIFTLDHSNPQEVFRCMSSKMKSMKKLISGDSINSIDCGENQLSVAAAMEAGSRSPLPPSPLNQHISDYEMNSSQNCVSFRDLISSSDSLNNISFNSISNSLVSSQTLTVKNVPNKTPRKLPSTLEVSPIENLNILESKFTTQHNCDKFKKIQTYETVSITTSIDPNKIVSSTVILNNPQTADILMKTPCTPPVLPNRNESAKTVEFDYESIENITDAWKTMGVNEVKHTERCISSADNDLINFACSRAPNGEKSIYKDVQTTMITKIIDIDFGEGDRKDIRHEGKEFSYDRLDFLSPNHNTSSGYKTIVAISATNVNRMHCSTHVPQNDYELIANPDIQPYRKADDNHQGYGIVHQNTDTDSLHYLSTNRNNVLLVKNNITVSDDNDQEYDLVKKKNTNFEPSPDHRRHSGPNYTVVSKPKEFKKKTFR